MKGLRRRIAAGAVLCFSGTLAAWAQTTAQPADSYEKAEAAFHEKDYARAADLFAQAEAADPGKSDALLFEGKSLANVGKFAEADAVLRRYAIRHADSADAFFMLGFVLHREDKPADSLKEYTQAATLATPKAEDLR